MPKFPHRFRQFKKDLCQEDCEVADMIVIVICVATIAVSATVLVVKRVKAKKNRK